MQKNISGFNRLARAVLAVLFLWLGLFGFSHVLAKAGFILLALWYAGEALFGYCPMFAMMGVRSVKDRLRRVNLFFIALLGMQVMLGYIWWNAGYEKLTGEFIGGMEQTLAAFASGVPYEIVATFLTGHATEYASTYAQLVQWGQLAIGVALVISAGLLILQKQNVKMSGYIIAILALLGGAFMNMTFWLAAGWTGPGTATANVAMFWPQLLLIYVWFDLLQRMDDTGFEEEEIVAELYYEQGEILTVREEV